MGPNYLRGIATNLRVVPIFLLVPQAPTSDDSHRDRAVAALSHGFGWLSEGQATFRRDALDISSVVFFNYYRRESMLVKGDSWSKVPKKS